MKIVGRKRRGSSDASAAEVTPWTPKWFLDPIVPAIRGAICRKRPWVEWFFWACLAAYSVVCVVTYFDYVAPWISGETNVRIGADSDRYWDFIKDAQAPDAEPLVSATGNTLGPVAIGLALKGGFAVMCFNFLLFAIAVELAGSIPLVNKGMVGFLFLLNAELLPTLTTLNKEILSLLAAVMTAKYLYSTKRSKLLLAATLLVSILARWEQAAILILYLVLSRFIFRGRPVLAVLSLITAITVGYPFVFMLLGVDPATFDWLLEGANTIVKMNHIQDAFGFPLVMIPKILMEMGGRLLSPKILIDGLQDDVMDFQQGIFQPLGCIALLLIFACAAWTKRLKLDKPIVLLSVITLIVTAASPFIQPRYLYGVYAMMSIEIARHEPRTRSSPAKRHANSAVIPAHG